MGQRGDSIVSGRKLGDIGQKKKMGKVVLGEEIKKELFCGLGSNWWFLLRLPGGAI